MSSFQSIPAVEPEIRNRNVIKILGIIEIIVAIICIIIGVAIVVLFTVTSTEIIRIAGSTIVVTASVAELYGYTFYNFGSGIWCGVWILVAGALATTAGGRRTSIRLVNCHIGFGIVGAVLSLILTFSGSLVAAVTLINGIGEGNGPIITWLHIVLAALGFVAFNLLIISTFFGCRSSPNNCCACCCGMQQPQVAHYPMQNYQQYPTTVS
ncbi:unnamed protein product [Clavelina lepadiformis]|uniref:Uncharacterized protein n=1 Tax=Clavelina lepadiformis TaxID=159417 RepID=A0ABP0GMJ6_CLALP